MTRVVEHEMEYPHPPEKVWRALTEPEQIAAWFPTQWGRTKVDFKAEVGATFRLEAEKKRGWRGHVTGEVLEVDAPRRLAFTWIGSPQEDASPTRVEWTLERTATGTRLRFTYTMTGFGGMMGWMAEKGAGASWRKMMKESLPALLANAPATVP